MSMQINTVKYLLRKMVEDVYGAMGVEMIILDRNIKVLVASGQYEQFEGRTVTSNYYPELALVMEKDLICYHWGDLGEIEFVNRNDLKDNYNDLIKEWKRPIEEVNSVTLPIKSAGEVVGAMALYFNDDMKKQPPVRMYSQIAMIDLLANLIGGKLEYINQAEIRSIEEVEKEMMLKALERYGNSSYDIKKISEKIGMNRSTFYRKCKKYEIDIHSIWD